MARIELSDADYDAIRLLFREWVTTDRSKTWPEAIALHFKAIGRAEAIADAARVCDGYSAMQTDDPVSRQLAADIASAIRGAA